MRTRYVAMTRPPRAAYDDFDWSDYGSGTVTLARTVHQAEPATIDTGLFDASGTKLYRIEEPAAIGFGIARAK